MRTLIPIGVVFSTAYLSLIVTHHANGGVLAVVLKVASVGVLVVLAAVSHPPRKLLIAALAFSSAGDLLLELRHMGSLGPVQLFLLGLIAFFVAHTFYVALFLRERSTTPMAPTRKIASYIVVVVVGSTLIVLWRGLAEMRVPVVAYSAVLAAMAITALLSRFPRIVAIGAVLFLASDTMLALSIFGHPFAGSRALVWVTYFVAQLLLAVGISSTQKRWSATA